jgi:DNA polymerase elongation subunit (family B)
MYTNIFIDKKNGQVHLWDDKNGHSVHPLSDIQYAYRKNLNGQYISLYGDKLEKIVCHDLVSDPSLFESDVPYETKFLLNKYLNDDSVSENRIVIVDIEVDSEGGYPQVDEGDKKITAIALYDKTGDIYYSFILDPDKKIASSTKNNSTTYSFSNEESLIKSFLTKWEEISPTIVTGWNTSSIQNGGFDIRYLYYRIRAVLGKNMAYKLSPIGIVYQNKFNKRMVVAGISLLDYIDLYKKFIGVMKSSYTLGNVAKDEELKIQKIIYRGSLTNLYKTDIKRYAELKN